MQRVEKERLKSNLLRLPTFSHDCVDGEILSHVRLVDEQQVVPVSVGADQVRQRSKLIDVVSVTGWLNYVARSQR